MLETRAVVVKVDGQSAMVRAEVASGCGHCAGKGCGASKLSRLFCSKPREFEVHNQINAAVGDSVIVAVADGAILRGVGEVYLIPLICLVLGGLTGSSFGPSAVSGDLKSAVGALAGLVAGFVIARWFSAHYYARRFQPRISRWSEDRL
jgi:sigma-E factor negative regulatory protein RseC